MNLKLTIGLRIALIACVGILFAKNGIHSAPQAGENMSQSIKHIKLGTSQFPDFSKDFNESIDHHPSGLIFYEYDWSLNAPGTVEFMHGLHSFVIDNVSTMMGTGDKNHPSEGISDWNIGFGVKATGGESSHEAARAYVMGFLAMLRAKGWKRFIDIYDPRLSGKQAWQYAGSPSIGSYSLDSMYTPTMEEWKAMLKNQPEWDFYADGVYIKITVLDLGLGHAVGQTNYLLGVEIQSEYEFYGIGYFPGEEEKIRSWKLYLPDELKRCHAERLKKEAELKAQGYHIDTAYQDPPIKALQAEQGNGH